MRKHRRFSPSQSERVINCPGSANLLDRVPARPSSVYAIEGTNAHDVLEAALANNCRKAEEAHRDYSPLCMEDLNTPENQFYWSVQVAINHVYSILDENPGAVMYLERYVDPPIDSAPGEAGGYCDIAIWVPSTRTLYIIDYKHGAGVAKGAKDNTQIRQYAGGFMFEENAKVDADSVDEVVLTIVQPRAFHEDGIIREHIVTPYEIWEYIDNYDASVLEALKDDAPLNPSKDPKGWCMFCDAKTVCPAREAMAIKAAGDQFTQIEQVTKPQLPNPANLDLERLGRVRQYAPMLRKFLDDVDAHCEELSRTGYKVPGCKLVEVQARRKYYGDEQDVAEKLAALIGCTTDDVMQKKLMTITQAEKEVIEAFKKRVGRSRKKQAAEDGKRSFAFLTLKQSSGNLTLVDDDDSRPAVNRAVESFQNLAIAPPTTEK